MPEGAVLPPLPAKAANIAAGASDSAASPEVSGEPGAPTFGEVLKGRMEKSEPPAPAEAGVEPPQETVALAVPGAVAAAPDAAALLAMLAGASVAGNIGGAGDPASAAALSDRGPRTVDALLATDSLPKGLRTRALTPSATTAGHEAVLQRATRADPLPAVPLAGLEPADRTPGSAAAPLEGAAAGSRALRAAAGDEVPGFRVNLPVAGAEMTGLVREVSAETRRTAATGAAQAAVSVPVGAAGWNDAVADRVTWVVQSRQPTAELQLNPPNLGPVEIHVSMSGDQASLSFFSPHAPVREALQAAMPRLSEAMTASGVELGSVFVGADPNTGQQAPGQERGSRGTPRDAGRAPDEVSGLSPARWTSRVADSRAVDLFA